MTTEHIQRHRRPSTAAVDESDPAQARPDPAGGVVTIGQIPPIEQPIRPHRRRLGHLPDDRLRTWITTIILTIIGGLTRLWDVGGATDNGTPLFDEKYYAVHAAEVLRNNGVEDNQGYGVVVHPPLGKQLLGLGEHLLGYTPSRCTTCGRWPLPGSSDSRQRDRRPLPDPRRTADRLRRPDRRRPTRPHRRVHQPGSAPGRRRRRHRGGWADPVVGLLITVAILGVLRSAVRQVGARLMDAVDPVRSIRPPPRS